MWIGAIELDLLLGDVHSLKTKRGLIRPFVRELRQRFETSAAEVDHADLHRRACVGVVCTSADHEHTTEILDRVERFTAARPEFELLSARRRLMTMDD